MKCTISSILSSKNSMKSIRFGLFWCWVFVYFSCSCSGASTRMRTARSASTSSERASQTWVSVAWKQKKTVISCWKTAGLMLKTKGVCARDQRDWRGVYWAGARFLLPIWFNFGLFLADLWSAPIALRLISFTLGWAFWAVFWRAADGDLGRGRLEWDRIQWVWCVCHAQRRWIMHQRWRIVHWIWWILHWKCRVLYQQMMNFAANSGVMGGKFFAARNAKGYSGVWEHTQSPHDFEWKFMTFW